MKKPTVAVVFGSRSTEHDISIITALSSVVKPLELSQKYHVVPVYIAKDGQWYSDPKLKHVELYRSGKLDAFLAKQKPVVLSLNKGLTLYKGVGFGRKEIKVDVVFPATHGTHGEDGELMSVCELANVAYVGCNPEASVIAMDKVLAKQVVQAARLATPKFVDFSKRDHARFSKELLKAIDDNLEYPLFVKPAHLGSSIAITRVTNKKELENAIEVALHYDDKALVEEAVQNLTEVTLPIIGNDELTPALLEEPMVKSEEFFGFETKYMQGGKGKMKGGSQEGDKGAQGYSRIPADLPEELYKKAEALGLSVYQALGCSGIARVDMLIDSKTKKVYFNEVNPLPGSLYAHNWAKAGLSTVQLVTKLIELAESRHKERQALATVFSSSFLQQF